MTDKSLSTGHLRLTYSIKSRYPELDDDEINRIANTVLDEVAKRIGSGDTLAFFRLGNDGNAEVITYALERIAKNK